MLHFLFLIMVFMSFVFLRLSHPVSMGMVLILHTLVVGLITGPIAGSFLFSYILFLVFLGGVLVLFIYMTSLASNEKFQVGWVDYIFMGVFVGLISLLTISLLLPTGVGVFSLDPEVGVLALQGIMVALVKLYSYNACIMTVFLVLFLLFALLVCVSVVGGKAGPLRNFN